MNKTRTFVYLTHEPGGSEQYWLYPEDEVLRRGGLEGLEYDLGETYPWFSRIGDMQLPSRKHSPISVPAFDMKGLVDAWVARGAPRQVGWRQKVLEVIRAIRHAVGQKALAPNHDIDHRHCKVSTVRLRPNQIPPILQRLDAGEIVDADATVTLAHWYEEHESLVVAECAVEDFQVPVIALEREVKDFRVSIWPEKSDTGFRVGAAVSTEGAVVM